MSTLERAIVIAAEGHAGVKDKGGAPYILHPLRMMLGLSSPENASSLYCTTSARIAPGGPLID
jgi:(p)ppGpp synthase/HD superfamily hydrolase